MDHSNEDGQRRAALPQPSHSMRLRSHSSSNPSHSMRLRSHSSSNPVLPQETTSQAAEATTEDPEMMRFRRPQRRVTSPEEAGDPQGSPSPSQETENRPQSTPSRRQQSGPARLQTTPTQGRASPAPPQPTPTRRQQTPVRPSISPFASSGSRARDPLGSLGSIEQECIGWGLDDTPTRSNRNRSNNPSGNPAWDFEIYEDPPDRASPNPPTPPTPTDPEEDKENIFTTASDLEDSEEEAQEAHVPAVDFDRVNQYTQSVFGPVEGPLGQLYVDPRGQVHRPTTRRPVSTDTTAPAMRVEDNDPDMDADDLWDDNLEAESEAIQARELRRAGNIFGYGSQYLLRGGDSVQGPSNAYSFADDEEGANRAMGIRRIVHRRPVVDSEDEEDDDEI